jgi:hypothetical protein
MPVQPERVFLLKEGSTSVELSFIYSQWPMKLHYDYSSLVYPLGMAPNLSPIISRPQNNRDPYGTIFKYPNGTDRQERFVLSIQLLTRFIRATEASAQKLVLVSYVQSSRYQPWAVALPSQDSEAFKLDKKNHKTL